MKVTKIKIENFRLLKSFELDLEKELSLVIGKNNCGKTSLLSILDKFIGSKANTNAFTLDDFNIDFQKKLKRYIENEHDEDHSNSSLGISLTMFIEYDQSSNLSHISKLMLDLDPKNNTIVLKFEYKILAEDLRKMRIEYNEYKEKQIELKLLDEKYNEVESGKVINNFLKTYYKKYFKIFRKSLGFDILTSKPNDDEYIDLLKEKISLDKIINFKMINAKRNVSNIDSDRTLSYLSSKYYEKNEEKENESDIIRDFKSALSKTDTSLNKIYSGLFGKIIEKVGRFGGINEGDSMIKIESTLNHKELLKDNTTVMYDHHGEHSLPENFNGLGYLNLISMIFEIELLLSDFRNDNKVNELSAEINLLFIEEPEAHTHPQMQYIFIKNIKDILRDASKGEDGKPFNLQTIISTHSCHITSESEFDDIKYFYKTDNNRVIAKNLKDLHKEYEKDGEINNYKFLKQYLTLHRSELFFADKAIFIEGDTERLLLPAMMKKIDQEGSGNPLLSQNISIIEVGAYSHIFEKFIAFIGVRSLIITDIDSAKKVVEVKDGVKRNSDKKCKVSDSEAYTTTNASLKYFINPSKYQQYIRTEAAAASELIIQSTSEQNNLEFYKRLSLENKLLQKDTQSKLWVQSKNGNVLVIYQTAEKNSKELEYHARSFEDSFFHLNRQFILDNKIKFQSLKNIDYFDDEKNDAYFLAEKCIDKKPSFAMEILLHSIEEGNKKYCNWEIPGYIKEGLIWLKNS